jgi:hypothetical protein
VLLAELEVWHSRPIAPTRRIALGHLALPVEPPPGFGGLLLGGVVAAHIGGLDAELVPDLHLLISQVEAGQRIVQPRLRHRFQVDRHGLARSRHRLVGKGEEITFDFEEKGSPAQQILGAVYAAERLDVPGRKAVCGLLHKAVRWNGGPVGPSLIAHLSGVHSTSVVAFANPVAWALDRLGFAFDARPSKRQVQARFRARLMDVHPDHGGDEVAASTSIAELGEARRILLG